MIDEFNYYNLKNRMRIVGTMMSTPEKYFISNHGQQFYCFFIKTTKRNGEAMFAPAVSAGPPLQKMRANKLVGKRVVAHGSVDVYTSDVKGKTGNDIFIYEQYLKLEDLKEATKPYVFDNIGAVEGKIVKKVDRTYPSGAPVLSVYLQVENEDYTNIVEVVTGYQIDDFKKLQVGEYVGFKCRMIQTSKEHVMPKLEAITIYNSPFPIRYRSFSDLDFTPGDPEISR